MKVPALALAPLTRILSKERMSLDVETGLDDDGEGDEAVEGEESGQALQIREAEAAGDDAADDGEELEDGVVDANVVLHLLGIDELKLLACGVRRLGGRRGGSVRRDPGGAGGSAEGSRDGRDARRVGAETRAHRRGRRHLWVIWRGVMSPRSVVAKLRARD